MMKLMFIGRRAAGRTRQAALDHLRDVHGKMVVCPPPDAGAMPADYVQNHVVDGAYPAAGGHAIERDLVTELWFDGVDHLRAATQTAYYLAKLKPDEPRFVDRSTLATIIVRPLRLREHGAGVFKAFLFIARGSADDAGWEAGRRAAASAFCAANGLAAAVENAVMPSPGGDPAFAEMVLEGWFAARDDAAAAVDRLGAVLQLFGAECVDADRSFALLAEQYDSRRLRDLHCCPTVTD